MADVEEILEASPKRWSANKKTQAVLRLLRGEPVQAARSAPLGCLCQRLSPSYKTGRDWRRAREIFRKFVSNKLGAIHNIASAGAGQLVHVL